MSFTGIFKADHGLIALADSKASIKEDGTYIENIGRNPEKLFVFTNGVAVTYGANQILVQNPNRLFSQKINLEDLVYEYLTKHHTLDLNFFQDLLIKMRSNPANDEPINFLIGRKIRANEYLMEHHYVGYNYYAQRIGSNTDHYFIGGAELYKLAFDQLNYSPYMASAQNLRKFVAAKLEEFVKFYDQTLPYNPVGGSIKSYILE